MGSRAAVAKRSRDSPGAAYERQRMREAALMRHLKRVNVKMPSAWQQLCAMHPSLEREPASAQTAALLSALEALPDGAGTEAFVAAYNARASNL